MKIKSCKINSPKSWGEQAKIDVIYENGSEEKNLISFFDNEISFTESEIIGKTRDEVIDLFYKKDREYLQS